MCAAASVAEWFRRTPYLRFFAKERTMKVTNKILSSLTLALVLPLGGAAMADDNGDSSADTSFVDEVEASQGMMIMVPINEQGEENTDAAEVRLDTSDVGVASAADISTAWESGLDVTAAPTVDGDINSDSSTGFRSRQCRGWQPAYTYRSYQPTYRYYSYTYVYVRPIYTTIRYGRSNYRCYYYNRGHGW